MEYFTEIVISTLFAFRVRNKNAHTDHIEITDNNF